MAIWLTYLLGAMVWSRGAGLIAALGLAIDRDAVSLASAGWRDDAFVATVVLCALLILRAWRLGGAPPRAIAVTGLRVTIDAAYAAAIALGLAGGVAILVRIFSASFLVGGAIVFLIALPTTWRRRMTMVGVAALVAAVVAGPYFVNCWRVFGDPLYSFNFHANIYRVAEGQQTSSDGTASYITSKIASQPFDMVDTLVLGVTSYPFGNKWRGLDPWWPGLARWAAVAGVAGLLLLPVSALGRLFMLIGLMSIAPFAFTWKIDATWRFTAHAYPFLLIAAAAALLALARVIVATGGADLARALRVREWRTALRFWAASAVISLVALWIATRVLPARVFAEALTNRAEAGFTAGGREGSVFGEGWSPVLPAGNVRMRAALAEGVLNIPLPDKSEYVATLRVDPFPRPMSDSPARLPVLDVVLNGTAIGRLPLTWNPDRVGAYDLVLPAELVRRGTNRLVLRLAQTQTAEQGGIGQRVPGLTDGDAFVLWYVRLNRSQR
jgi:4-amino-4-deoxy-L-arabinose transferase-like glycosyltransferase